MQKYRTISLSKCVCFSWKWPNIWFKVR